jgi:hypothetical protein
LGSGGGITSNKRVSERLLKEGDVAYVLGELTVSPGPRGTSVRTVRVAQDGRRLLVSNLNEDQLFLIEKLWLWIGAAFFVTSVLVLAWSFYQRYQVNVVPGVLL